MEDIIAQVIWFAIPFTPIITLPITWKMIKSKWYIRVIIGLFLALILSLLFYGVSLEIVFMDGMGPT